MIIRFEFFSISANVQCSEGMFKCIWHNETISPETYSKCIPEAWHCDHGDDCPEGVDEVGCVYSTECNVTGQFKCANGNCIYHKWQCDHDLDCEDGSDEKDCVYPPCKENEFQCPDLRCVPAIWVCDGDGDCPTKTEIHADEVNCNRTTLVCTKHRVSEKNQI